MPRASAPDTLSAAISTDPRVRAIFHSTADIHLRSAPGRLDLLGGLAADAGGTLAHIALSARAAVAVQLHGGDGLAFYRTGHDAPLRLNPDELPAPDAWHAPLATLYHAYRLRHPAAFAPFAGLAVAVHSDIPASAAQAATTALLAAFLVALSDAARAPMDPNNQALFITRARARTSGSHPAATPDSAAAITDALTCLLAPPPSSPSSGAILRYNTQPPQLIREVPLPPEVQVLALDTGVRHTRIRATLDELHIAQSMALRLIETIYRDLGQPHTPLHGYLANTSPLLYRQYFRTLLPRRMRASDFIRTYGPIPEPSLGPVAPDPATFFRVRTVADHLIAEHEHAEQFVQAMEELAGGDAAGGIPAITDPAERQRTLHRAGRLLLASHHSYRLRLELSCPQADWLIDRLMEAGPDKGIYGARITATGGGGTVTLLCDRSSQASDVLLDARRDYQQHTGLPLGITPAGGDASAGALQRSAITLQLP